VNKDVKCKNVNVAERRKLWIIYFTVFQFIRFGINFVIVPRVNFKYRNILHTSTIIRPPDIVVDGLTFYRDSSFFFHCLIPELAERNSIKIDHMIRSNCDLKTHVHTLGYPLSLQTGSPKTTFLDDFET